MVEPKYSSLLSGSVTHLSTNRPQFLVYKLFFPQRAAKELHLLLLLETDRLATDFLPLRAVFVWGQCTLMDHANHMHTIWCLQLVGLACQSGFWSALPFPIKLFMSYTQAGRILRSWEPITSWDPPKLQVAIDTFAQLHTHSGPINLESKGYYFVQRNGAEISIYLPIRPWGGNQAQ